MVVYDHRQEQETAMPWPLAQDYNEAVQDPRLCFADDDLRAGAVVTNALGLPMPCSGNFADVYEMRSAAGDRRWAVKCFTRAVPGQRERYAAISDRLRQARLRFTVEFQYLEQGIRVAGQWYPVLKMDWVDGLLLNEFVRSFLDRPAMLEALAKRWAKLARKLRSAGIAHGDLQHGNVLLVPGRDEKHLALKLIDYDGMYVPTLADVPSGEVGHPSYQHPQRLRDATYNAEADRFPLLVIYTAIRALMAGGRPLWERFDNGDNLLFCRQDFEAPTRSALFAALLKADDPAVRSLAETLIDAARSSLDQVPLLNALANGERAVPVAAALSAPGAWAVAPTAVASARRDGNAGTRVRRRLILTAGVIASITAVTLLGGVGLLLAMMAGARSPDERKAPVASAAQIATGPKAEKYEQKIPPVPSLENTPGVAKAGPNYAHGLVNVKPESTVTPDTVGMAKPFGSLPTTFKNGLGIEFVLVPRGKSWLGGGSAVPGAKEVDIAQDFYLGKYEVTQEEWQNVMGNNPSFFARTGKGSDAVKTMTDAELKLLPVENVSWNDGQAFVAAVNKRVKENGWLYRLPTELEWEYACRGGPLKHKMDSAYDYYLEQPLNRISPGQANFKPRTGTGRTHKVGTYKPNSLGLYDMHGNVWEWCADTVVDLRDLLHQEKGDLPRVERGGCWHDPANGLFGRAAARISYPASYRSNDHGLRLARVPVGK
jgi:formylglycine-generating enzyme required for sulfatase activity